MCLRLLFNKQYICEMYLVYLYNKNSKRYVEEGKDVLIKEKWKQKCGEPKERNIKLSAY